MALSKENIQSLDTESLRRLLAQQVEANRIDLVGRYQKALRATLFTNRTEVRPNMLGTIAADEAAALINFLNQGQADTARGVQLGQLGLNEQAVLRLNQTTRQFFLTHLESSLIAPALDLLDTHQNAVIQGFIQSVEKNILNEQERIRSALQLAVSNYTVEIKEIQALAQQATEASEFKTRFMARISHELRTPLGALLGIAEMLQENVYGPLTPAQQDITQRIINNAYALERIFAELLDQAQIESGELRLKEERFSPHTLIQTVQSNCMPLALQKGLSMSVELDTALPAMVSGDRARVEQILSNLVVNAIKFTETGTILIHAVMEGQTHWRLQVKDSGIGIAPEDQAYIFESFRQVDETSKRKYGGVGLGLSIVQQLVAAMHGTVSVESKVGQGSTFTVTLPV